MLALRCRYTVFWSHPWFSCILLHGARFHPWPCFTFSFFHSSTSKHCLHLSALFTLWSMQFLSHYFESVPCSWFDRIIFTLSTVSWMRSTTRLPLSLRSLVYSREMLQQPNHKPQLPSIPGRGRERPHVADYEINIHDKPLKPQNYFMWETVAEFHHWEKHHSYWNFSYRFLFFDNNTLYYIAKIQ